MANGDAKFVTWQFVDYNGVPYSAVEVNTYVDDGGTTPKNTWLDAAKTQVAANPIIGNAEGRVSFWADGDYRIVVKTAGGAVTLFTWDGVRITSDTGTLWEGNQGISTPTASSANLFQTFALHDSSNNFISYFINEGSSPAFRDTRRKIVKSINVNDTLYTVTTNEEVITVDCGSGTGSPADITVNLPTSASNTKGKRFFITKIDSSINTVTVDGASAQLINGEATITLFYQYDYVEIESNGVDGWRVISQSGNLGFNVKNGITASTIQTQGQSPLTRKINEISTVANTNDTVTLPPAYPGAEVYIFNNGAATLQIFPAVGDDLGSGINTSMSLLANNYAYLVAYDTTNWKQLI